jgi:hypothetical protein
MIKPQEGLHKIIPSKRVYSIPVETHTSSKFITKWVHIPEACYAEMGS